MLKPMFSASKKLWFAAIGLKAFDCNIKMLLSRLSSIRCLVDNESEKVRAWVLQVAGSVTPIPVQLIFEEPHFFHYGSTGKGFRQSICDYTSFLPTTSYSAGFGGHPVALAGLQGFWETLW